jgi:hypothetical protein
MPNFSYIATNGGERKQFVACPACAANGTGVAPFVELLDADRKVIAILHLAPGERIERTI